MPRPARKNAPVFWVTPHSQEILTDVPLAVTNFLALFAATLVTCYADGRIKARSARGAWVDLPRFMTFEKNCFEFDPAQWITIINDADAKLKDIRL